MVLKRSISNESYARITLVALISLVVIVATGAAVRLTGSGLGCPGWPACDGEILAPADLHAWIEYGNRLFSGIVGFAALAAGLAAWWLRPFRRELAIIGSLLPIGVIAQALLGALTVKHELEPGFVMAHFGLSYLILIASVALAWLAAHPSGWRERATDRVSVWAVRLLLPLVTLLVFLGTVTTAAGPHAGSAATGEVVNRLTFKGVETFRWMIEFHGRLGTFTGICIVAVWLLLRRRKFSPSTQKALLVTGVLMACQGAVGLIQYKLRVPPELVWVHVLLATLIWLSVLWAVASAGRLAPRRD